MAQPTKALHEAAAPSSAPIPQTAVVDQLYAAYRRQPKGSEERQSAFNILMKAIEDESRAR